MPKASKQTKPAKETSKAVVKNNEAKKEIKRVDHLTDDRKVDLTKKPKNNGKVNRMQQRFLYGKTGNWVVYARMLQIKRSPKFVALEGNVIRTKDDGYEGGKA